MLAVDRFGPEAAALGDAGLESRECRGGRQRVLLAIEHREVHETHAVAKTNGAVVQAPGVVLAELREYLSDEALVFVGVFRLRRVLHHHNTSHLLSPCSSRPW